MVAAPVESAIPLILFEVVEKVRCKAPIHRVASLLQIEARE
jgi:hypothetical protein